MFDAVCVRCGKPHYGNAIIYASWGEDDNIEYDEAELCEDCYRHVIETCGIIVKTYTYSDGQKAEA